MTFAKLFIVIDLPVIKKKTLSVFIFFVLQVFFLDAYGSSKKVDEKINSKDKLEKKYFPTTNVKGVLFFTFGFSLKGYFGSNFLIVLHKGPLKHKVSEPPGQFSYCFSQGAFEL